jgi:hypothetical protein
MLPLEREALPGGSTRVTVTLQNDRMTPTRLEQEASHHLGPPDIVRLTGDGPKVIASGVVTDRFRQRMEPTRRRPERVELRSVPGMGQVRVQFLVAGRGPVTVTYDSAKGGVRTATLEIP